jgi:spermidine synthase
MHITALELDPVVVEVARSHFGCSPDVVDVRVADGIAFVTDLAARIQACGTLHERAALQKHLIVIDVDSKDLTDELLSFPPPPFVDIGYLRHVRSCLRPRGALMMNFGVHKHSMRRQIVSSVIDVFGPQSHVYEISIENDQNRILVAVAPPESDLNASSSASCAACSLPLTREAALAKVPTLARFMSLKASQGLLGDIEVMLRRIKVWHVPNHQPVDADWEMLSE